MTQFSRIYTVSRQGACRVGEHPQASGDQPRGGKDLDSGRAGDARKQHKRSQPTKNR